MLAFIAGRLVAAIPVLLVLSQAVFVLLHIGPGDPALVLLGENGEPDALALARANLGLDQPLPVQYGRWLMSAAHGDLGRSIRTHQPVGETILARLPVTIELGVLSMVVALVIGLPLGVFSALHRNSVLDAAGSSVSGRRAQQPAAHGLCLSSDMLRWGFRYCTIQVLPGTEVMSCRYPLVSR
jgi:peptide/nickel transport system permease protein